MTRRLVLFALLAALCRLPQTAHAEPYTMGLVTAQGKVDDKTFNEAAWKGLSAAASEVGGRAAYIESAAVKDAESNLKRFIGQGTKLVVGVGYMMGDVVLKLAKANPEIRFVLVDHAFADSPKNLVGITFAEEDGGVLAGALAGLVTRSNMVGFVGGPPIPPVKRWRDGYEAGVKLVNSAAKIKALHLESFVDPAKGKAAASGLLAEGVDVLFGAGGISGSAAILEAAAQGAWVIGVDQDEHRSTFRDGKTPGADRVLTSAVKDVEGAVRMIAAAAAKGEFSPGEKRLDVASGGVRLSAFHEAEAAVTPAMRERLEAVRCDLAAKKRP